MKKGNSLLLILALVLCLTAIQSVELKKVSNEKEELEIIRHWNDSNFEELEQENIRLRRIGVLLFNHVNPKSVQKDTALINTMINYRHD